MMANIVKKARFKQRSVVITLLDLKNAFDEVRHNLIQSVVLDYHHIPESGPYQIGYKKALQGLSHFNKASEFHSPFIIVGRGVLQGDCLSPQLFNMCFNTFLQRIKIEKYRQLGFSSIPSIGSNLLTMRPL